MIQFNLSNAQGNAVNWANRLAARRQTEEQRNAVFRKYQAMVGTIFRDNYMARQTAIAELGNPELTPEYWDEDLVPRKPLNLSSSMLASIRPAMGGAFVTYHSNPSKQYWQPGAGTTAATAKRIESLLLSPDIGKMFRQRGGI